MDKQAVRAPRRRREHSVEFKRELVARSLEPGVSVAAIAMDSGINANLLFGWRRRHLESLAQAEPAPVRSPVAVLLPVSIETGPREIHRGRRGDILKVLWFDGQGLMLLAKRLERGRFVWPQADSGSIALTPAQLSMLLEGLDWRMPVRTHQPELAA